jgi:hypothetical protein
MSFIAEAVNKPVKVVQCITMFNEMEFAPLVLASLYTKVDQIICVEGAVKNNSGASEDGHSTDGTLEFLKEFKQNNDPDDKLNLISINRPWESLEEQKQCFLDLTQPGDILLINDADEYYLPEDIDRIKKFFDRNPYASELVPTFLHFYRDFSHIAVPGPEWSCQHQRIIKHPGYGAKYNSHPVLTDSEGHCTYFSGHYQPRRFVPSSPIYIWHYGYARSNMDDRMKQKQEYYTKELAKHDNANQKFDEKISAWFHKTEPVLCYNGEHPPVMKQHKMYVDNESNVAENEKCWLEDDFYSQNSKGLEVGNIHLCMSRQSQPHMNHYHNGAEI